MAYGLYFDGFEHYAAASDMSLFGYTDYQGTISASGGRRSSKGLALALGMYGYGGIRRSFTASNKCVVGIAAYGVITGRGLFLEFRNGDTVHGNVTIYPNAALGLSVGGTSIGNSSSVVPANTWMFYEFGLSVANSGGTYEVRVNGSSVGWFPAATGDTQNGATTTIDNVYIGITGGYPGASNSNFVIDDFYVTFGDELKWLGDCRVDKLALTGNSTPMDWTPSSGNAWERLNAGDGTVSSNTDEQTALFDVADLSTSPAAIWGIAYRSLQRKSDSGTRETCLVTKSDTTEVESSLLTLSTDYLGIQTILKEDPATATNWLAAGVNAHKIGFRVKT